MSAQIPNRFAVLETPLPQAMAHRGGSVVAPENTVEAFAHAVALGYRYLETDVRLSADGVLMVMHDPDLQRVAGRSDRVCDLTAAELQAIDLGDRTRIPTMAELFDAFPQARFNIDPKSDDSVDPLIELIRERQAIDRVCIGSFSEQRLRRMRAGLGPRLCTSPAQRGLILTLAAAYLRLPWRPPYGCVQMPTGAYRIPLDRPGTIRRLQRLGLQVHYWTINDEFEIDRLLDAGADMVITDEVELARSVLLRRGAWTAPT